MVTRLGFQHARRKTVAVQGATRSRMSNVEDVNTLKPDSLTLVHALALIPLILSLSHQARHILGLPQFPPLIPHLSLLQSLTCQLKELLHDLGGQVVLNARTISVDRGL